MPIDYNNKKIIPNPCDEDTRMNTTISRIIDRLPSLEGMGGKVLVVSADEEKCAWTAVAGVTHDYRDLTYKPKLNGVELNGEQTSAQLSLVGLNDTATLTNKTLDCSTGGTSSGNNSITNVPLTALASMSTGDAGKTLGVQSDGTFGLLDNMLGKVGVTIVDTLPSSPVAGTLYFEKATGTVAYYG